MIKKIAIALFALLLGAQELETTKQDREQKPYPQTLRLIFIGDVMMHQSQLDAAKRSAKRSAKSSAKSPDSWDFKPSFAPIKRHFKQEQKPLVIANLETTLNDEASGYPSFSAPDTLAQSLRWLGVDVLTLANNHIFDKGASGALRSMRVLEHFGLAHVGLGHNKESAAKPLLIEREGFRVAIANYSYGSNAPQPRGLAINVISEENIVKGLESARALKPDLIVLCLHWGQEYESAFNKAQERVARLAARHGADLIIGTHPHVLQGFSLLDGSGQSFGGKSLVAWSLGNFISAQQKVPRERSVLLAVDLKRDEGGKALIHKALIAPIRVKMLVDKSGAKRYELESLESLKEALFSKQAQASKQILQELLKDFKADEAWADAWGFYEMDLSR